MFFLSLIFKMNAGDPEKGYLFFFTPGNTRVPGIPYLCLFIPIAIFEMLFCDNSQLHVKEVDEYRIPLQH